MIKRREGTKDRGKKWGKKGENDQRFFPEGNV